MLRYAAILSFPAVSSAQDATAGQKVFNQCRSCHLVGPTAKNGVGPELNGLFGRASGSVPGFNYSEANKSSGITWDVAAFSEYIRYPKAKMPGTKMAFAGLRDDRQIEELTAYLKQFNADGKTTP